VIISGSVVVTMDASRRVYAPGIVVVENGVIRYVGGPGTWSPGPDDRLVDCPGHLIMPGLVNTHTHVCFALFRGLAEDRPRDAWPPHYALPYQDRMDPDAFYWGAMLGGLEMLTNGITTVADRFAPMAPIADALDRLGMRAVVCHTVADVGRPLDWDQAMALIDRWGVSPSRRVHCGIGPHAPDTCSDDLLRRVRAFARETSARIFIHCAQSEAELAALRARGHTGAVRCLARLGLLGLDLVAAHCIYVDEEEIRLLADAGTWVAHCPASNAKIEARTARVAAMLQAGVRVALGTDWAPTNNGMDLFDEMKIAGLLGKVTADDPTALPVDRLLAMATVDAARALGLGQYTGSLEPEKRADIITLAMDGLHLQPWHDVAATLVYSAKGLDVRHVWVDGRQVVRDRQPVGVDVDDIRTQVQRLWRRVKGGRT
jgi:5-methylthioadenosine/S-adenosylhomocysteine deaminase